MRDIFRLCLLAVLSYCGTQGQGMLFHNYYDLFDLSFKSAFVRYV